MNAQARIRGWITRDPLAAAFVLLTVPLYAAAILITPLRPWGGYVATILLGGWVVLALATGLKEQRRRFRGVAIGRSRSQLENALRLVSLAVPLALWIYSRVLADRGATDVEVGAMRDGSALALLIVWLIWMVVGWTLQQRFNARSTAA